MIAGIEMFLGADGKQVAMKMTEYQMAANYTGSITLMIPQTIGATTAAMLASKAEAIVDRGQTRPQATKRRN